MKSFFFPATIHPCFSLAFAACVGPAFFLLAGCGGENGDQAEGGGPGGPGGPPTRVVTTATAEVEDLQRYLDALGETNAFRYVEIKPQVTALITEIHFEQGEAVEEGQKLFTLQKGPFEAAVKQARGELMALEAQLDIARREAKRSEALVDDQLLSTQEYQSLLSRVEELRGQIEAARGRLEAAEVELGFTSIVAPVAGLAGFHQVNVGNLVEPRQTTPLTTIRTIDPIYVDFSVPVDRFSELRARHGQTKGQIRVRVTPLNNPDIQREARLEVLGTSVERATGTVDLRATMPNEDQAFWPQEPIRARVFLEELPNTVVVPRAAVQLSQEGPFVMLVADIEERDTEQGRARFGTTRRQSVTTGQRQEGGRIAILEGLKGGEEVVLEGQIFLQPDSEVKISAPGRQGGAGGPPGGGGRRGRPGSNGSGSGNPEPGSPREGGPQGTVGSGESGSASTNR
ncbi:MAG: efflux RND transporter periplasmic adaptor subunit [Opitutales bacterium]